MVVVQKSRKKETDRFKQALHFVLQKFLIDTETIDEEGAILNNNIKKIKTQVMQADSDDKINKLRNIVNNTKQTYD